MRIRHSMIAALAVLALVGVACGGDETDGVASLGDGAAASPSAAADGDTEAQLLDWARCMRDEGVDVPDPEVDADGNVQIGLGGDGPAIDPGDPDVQAAFEACQELLAGGGELPELDPDQKAAFADAQLEFARCMNDEGIEVPEPTGDQGLFLGPDSGIDPNDPDVQAALEVCLPIMQDVFPVPGGEG